MQSKKYQVDFGGRTLTAEFTDLANQTNGSVIIKYGNTAVLATAVMGKQNKESDYFPLTVEYEEKFYASGMIRGSQYVRREGRPSDDSVLRGRIVDRTLRPLFDHHIRREVQVVITTLATDEYDPDIFGVIAASLATATSDIPWNGPVGAVRIARKKGEQNFIVNPPFAERPEDGLDIDMVVCGKDGLVNMIEVEAGEVSESDMTAALTLALTHITAVENFQKQIIAEIGKAKQTFEKPTLPEAEATLFTERILPKLDAAMFSGPGKEGIHTLFDEWETVYREAFPEGSWQLARQYYEDAINDHLHKEAIAHDRRPDARKLDELRSLFGKAGGISDALHGSGIFYRGDTHIFTALTLGGPDDSQTIDGVDGEERKKRFLHHYNFPPYSVGETGRMGGTNRRMIGHGALAEKSLRAVLPPKDQFPYTIRLVSETLSSNGSSSMGSVCASILALMDGGVPITRPVAGIAMGLMYQSDEAYSVLTDIQGPEDEHGDMDFKVAGTDVGITGVQLDVKVSGIALHILSEALIQAKKARLEIISVLTSAISAPRSDVSPRAPKIIMLRIEPKQIGLVIGSGGKTINGIREETGVEEITIEDDGLVYITGKNGTADAAAEKIRSLTRIFEVGERLDAEITRIAPFGAFARLNDQNEGLIHISEIVPWRLETVEGILKVGDIVPVVVSKIEDGKVGLSIKKVDPQFGEKKGLKAPEKK